MSTFSHSKAYIVNEIKYIEEFDFFSAQDYKDSICTISSIFLVNMETVQGVLDEIMRILLDQKRSGQNSLKEA